jgi:hypothetical protein
MIELFLFLDMIKDWGLFWTAVSAVVALLVMIGGLLIWIVNQFFIDPVKQENKQLKREIDTKLQLPSYSLDAVRLTELATKRKIEEIEIEYEKAVEEKDEQLASELSKHLKEIEQLRNKLEKVSNERTSLQQNLQTSLSNREFIHAGNALGLPTGFIMLIKQDDKYGALKAIDQSSRNRGSFIKYYWWYQPDGTGKFTSSSVQFGYEEGSEGKTGSDFLEIGPIKLEWSAGSEGQGWVYFGSTRPSEEIELVVTTEIDISRIDAKDFNFLKPKVK